MWVCVDVCCVAAVVKNSVLFSLGVLKYVYICVRHVIDGMFSVCIVRRGAADARAWEGILQSRSHDCRVAMSVSFCLPHPVAVSAFIICRGLCACTKML